MSNIQPKSIGQIYNQIDPTLFAKWFRVRDVLTLRDYLILDFSPQQVRWAEVVCLDDQIYRSMSCTERKYALLSNMDELAVYRKHKRNAVVSLVLYSYTEERSRIRAKGCEVITLVSNLSGEGKMEIRVTSEATQCAACNWYIYQGQKLPCRIMDEYGISGGSNVKFYCSERCYNNPDPHHHFGPMHFGPVS